MTTAKPEGPKRRFELKLEIGADSKEELFMLMDYFQRVITEGSQTCVSGGYGSGGSFQLEERKEQTHDKWYSELQECLEQSRKDNSSGK